MQRSFRVSLAPSEMGGAEGQMKIFLCGDVMTGRGVDQALPHPGDPGLFEPWVSDAREYLRLAVYANGDIPVPVAPSYIWGEALAELERQAPAVRIVNLETAVTAGGEPWPGKGIHYRMHPANIACLTAAQLDVCVLANNHVLDWGYEGLAETLTTLRGAGIVTVGAGRDLDEARAPAIIETASGRVLVFAWAATSSGVPAAWAATPERAGVHLLETLAADEAERLVKPIRDMRRRGDIVVASIHWGGNWGYELPPAHGAFAHALIDAGGVDCVHGHSSHHPLGIEIYRGRPILYGCGDFLNDYEGIRGYEEYRSDLTAIYFPCFDLGSGELSALRSIPMRIRRLQVVKASPQEAGWLASTLAREGLDLATSVSLENDGTLAICAGGRP
jgi:poly-gamma-glutamate synthesis protein (capsule biosynthesis protein)